MLTYRYFHTIDPSGRLIIPSKYRDDVGETFVITRGHNRCLYLLPMDSWEVLKSDLLTRSKDNPEERRYRRYFVFNAATCTVDKQWRVIIPQELRDFANIGKDVVVAGNLDMVEIWNKEAYVEYGADDDDFMPA